MANILLAAVLAKILWLTWSVLPHFLCHATSLVKNQTAAISAHSTPKFWFGINPNRPLKCHGCRGTRIVQCSIAHSHVTFLIFAVIQRNTFRKYSLSIINLSYKEYKQHDVLHISNADIIKWPMKVAIIMMPV
jgi:hypothetical protein